jgi:hypothetical protein
LDVVEVEPVLQIQGTPSDDAEPERAEGGDRPTSSGYLFLAPHWLP